jgi:hypothetical protein
VVVVSQDARGLLRQRQREELERLLRIARVSRDDPGKVQRLEIAGLQAQRTATENTRLRQPPFAFQDLSLLEGSLCLDGRLVAHRGSVGYD